MDYERFAARLSGGRKLIYVHGNADCDAVGSAYALSACFGDSTICAPGGVERVAKLVSEKLGIRLEESADPSDYDTVVAVDCSSPDQLAPAEVPVDRMLVIDHHRITGRWDGADLLCDDSAVSCAQVVRRILKAKGYVPDTVCAKALCAAMLTDSGRFQYADPELLRDFAELMEESGLHMDEALEVVKAPVSMSERVADLKCVGRSRFERVGDMLVAISYGGSFEASGCHALLSAGADVAFVASQRDDVFRISGRATQQMTRRGVHLGELMSSLGTEVDADGGGHSGAAGISGNGDMEAMLNICMAKTMDAFRAIKKREEAERDRNDPSTSE